MKSASSLAAKRSVAIMVAWRTPTPLKFSPSGPLRATIRPPGSKSITNRAWSAPHWPGQSIADRRAGQRRHPRDDRIAASGWASPWNTTGGGHGPRVGCGGHLPVREADLHVANSGTTVRFLTAMLTLGHGAIDSTARRGCASAPSKTCCDALRQLGADAFLNWARAARRCVVRADGLPGGRATVAGNISSQFLSGLLMAAPYAERRRGIGRRGKLVSRPYIEMTLAVMHSFGVGVQVRSRAGSQSPPRNVSGSTLCDRARRLGRQLFLCGRGNYAGEVTVEGLSRR